MDQPVSDITSAMQPLLDELGRLRASLDEMSEKLSRQSMTIDRQTAELIKLRRENRELRERLGEGPRPPKNSGNSSVPPSKEGMRDEALRRTRSLRERSGLPSGGQKGHPGSTLEKQERSGPHVDHIPGRCELCGRDLSGIEPVLEYTTQVIDVPLAMPTVTEHRHYARVCRCGCRNKGAQGRRGNSVVYGRNIRAVIVYLSVVQCLPYKRLVEALKALFGIEPSEGTVSNIIEEARIKSAGELERIRERISRAGVAGFDETGCYCNGRLDWAWVGQTPEDTYVFRAKGRGHECLEAEFGDSLRALVAVSDRHGAYFAIDFKGHQVCIAHLLRNLEYLNELDRGQTWSAQLQALLRDAVKARNDRPGEAIDPGSWLAKLDRLLQHAVGRLHEDFARMKNALIKCRNYLFTFLSDPEVPPTNNASERGFRKTKVKQKISGLFRSEAGADAYFAVHSVADSALKKGKSPFEAILALF